MRRREFIAAVALITAPGSWRLARAAPLADRALFASQKRRGAAIGHFPEFGDGQFLFDYTNARAGQVQQNSGGQFSLLATLVGPGNVVATGRLSADGLEFGGELLARLPIQRQTFHARNGDVRLDAEVATRPDVAPKGTMVLLHGSGPGPKVGLDLWAFYFLLSGWNVITFDKRGSGQSGGDWLQAGLETLAADAAAVIAAAPHAPHPIGAWGISQAGWVIPQLSRCVDFAIVHAGAATTPGEQMVDAVEAEMLAYGAARQDIDKAVEYTKLDVQVSMQLAPWGRLKAAYDAAAAERAEWLRGPPDPEASPFRTFIRKIAGFNPEPYWRSFNKPVLAIFGGKDVIVPAAKNLGKMQSYLSGVVRSQIVLLPNSNHLGFIGAKGVRREYPMQTNFDPDYFGTIDRWLQGMN